MNPNEFALNRRLIQPAQTANAQTIPVEANTQTIPAEANTQTIPVEEADDGRLRQQQQQTRSIQYEMDSGSQHLPSQTQPYYLSVPGLSGRPDYQRQKQLSLIDRSLMQFVNSGRNLKQLNKTIDQPGQQAEVRQAPFTQNAHNLSVDNSHLNTAPVNSDPADHNCPADLQYARQIRENKSEMTGNARQFVQKGRRVHDYNVFADAGLKLLAQNNQ